MFRKPTNNASILKKNLYKTGTKHTSRSCTKCRRSSCTVKCNSSALGATVAEAPCWLSPEFCPQQLFPGPGGLLQLGPTARPLHQGWFCPTCSVPGMQGGQAQSWGPLSLASSPSQAASPYRQTILRKLCRLGWAPPWVLLGIPTVAQVSGGPGQLLLPAWPLLSYGCCLPKGLAWPASLPAVRPPCLLLPGTRCPGAAPAPAGPSLPAPGLGFPRSGIAREV